jgi:hypothetical protein
MNEDGGVKAVPQAEQPGGVVWDSERDLDHAGASHNRPRIARAQLLRARLSGVD